VGIKQFYCMAVGQGVLVAVDGGGTVSCLDLKDGKVLWQNRLVGQVRYANAPPWIGGDLVVVQHNNMRTVTAFSLAKGGRVVGKWEAKQFSQCDLTADGLLVLLIDGELTVREVGQINKPLWTHRYDGSRFPAVLACSTESVVVSPDQTGGPLEVLSIPGSGRKVATLKLADVNGMQAVPVDAQFDGQALYVICSAQMIGRRKAYYGRMSSCRGVAVQKFEVPTEKRLWSRMLEDASQYYPNVLPLTVGKDHVVVTARQYNVGMDHFVYVLEAGTGKEVQKINLQVKAGGDAQAQQRRRQGMGQPAMTTGRLVVETSEGVTVYGEK